MKIFLFISMSILTLKSYAQKATTLPDNVLFAFDKCKVVGSDLKAGVFTDELISGFDLHCIKHGDEEVKCDYFDLATNKKTINEKMSAVMIEQTGTLKNAGTQIKFFHANGKAFYEESLVNEEKKIYARKICLGFFLFEKDAKAKKKNSL